MSIKFTFLIFIFFCPILTRAFECGIQKESKGQALIVGGEVSYPGQSPWLASLHKLKADSNRLEYFCGSTLISDRRLITGNELKYMRETY